MAKGLNLLFGAARIGNVGGWNGVADEEADDRATTQVLGLLKKNGVTQLDSAIIYGKSEETLGRFKAGTDLGFAIETKWPGGMMDPESTTKERVVSDAHASLARLGTSKVHAFYFHSADPKEDFEDALAGANEVYQSGSFKHLGLSNYSPSQVQKVYDICKRNGWVLPTVYQVLYNPVNRVPEEELFPLLRKLGIAINAYSPLAGGFLTNPKANIVNRRGRFNPANFGGFYAEMYNKQPYLDAHDEWCRIAEKAALPRAEIAYRWMEHHSALKAEAGDGIVLGGRLEQIQDGFDALKAGPLRDEVVKAIQSLWDNLRPQL